MRKLLTDYTIEYQLTYFDKIVKLAYIINNTDNLDRKEYQLNIDLNTSIY